MISKRQAINSTCYDDCDIMKKFKQLWTFSLFYMFYRKHICKCKYQCITLDTQNQYLHQIETHVAFLHAITVFHGKNKLHVWGGVYFHMPEIKAKHLIKNDLSYNFYFQMHLFTAVMHVFNIQVIINIKRWHVFKIAEYKM